MALETLALEHVPAQYAVHVALFQDVRNADFLHKQLLARNAAFEYAFIDASIVRYLFFFRVSAQTHHRWLTDDDACHPL